MELGKKIAAAALRELRAFQVRTLAAGLKKNFLCTMDSENRKASELVSVVVAINDSPEVVDRCLSSLQSNEGEAQVILVNDGSAEATRSLVKKYSECASWKVIEHSRPQGHSKACQSGVAIADRPIVCLLNSDTIVPNSCWRAIIEAFAHSQEIAVVGPCTSHATTQQCLKNIAGRRFEWTDAQIAHFAHRCAQLSTTAWWPGPRNGRHCVSVREISGFAFFIRREIWNRFGGFDSRFDAYGNETDLCLRLLKADYGLSWALRSYIHHLGKQSYGRGGAQVVDERRAKASRMLAETHGDELWVGGVKAFPAGPKPE